jgi:hypothetical protein
MGLFGRIAGKFVKDRTANTKTALQLIIEDFKRYILILKWIFLGFSFATIIYSIVVGIGNLIINCILLGVLLIYALLDAIFKLKQKPDPSRKLRIIYAWTRIALNAAALISSLYAIYSATIHEIKPISIVLATLSLIMFILKVLTEICMEIFQSKWTLLKNAMIMDAKEHPNTSGKLFSPIIGDVEGVEVKESVAERIRKRQDEE